MRAVLVLIFSLYALYFQNLYSQEKIEIEGAIQIANSEEVAPNPGTIRWTGSDFEGWNGYFWVSLTIQKLGEISDLSGNVYKTVKIGDTEWMIENLRTTVYNDSTPIVEVTDTATWGIVSAGAYCWYANDFHTNSTPYGALYNWFAVETGNLCPSGWRIPNDNILGASDFADLVDIYGMFTTAPALKSTGTIDDGSGFWSSPNHATNESGFTGHPAGRRLVNGNFGALGNIGTFWTNEEDATNNANSFRRELNQNNDVFIRYSSDKNQGASIRCVKN